MLRAAAARTRHGLDRGERAWWAARRLRWIAAVRTSAERRYAAVELDIARDVRIGRRVRVTVEPNTRNRVVIGAGTIVGDDVSIRLAGGRIDLGAGVVVRRGAALNVAGDLSVGDHTLISWGTVIHCHERVQIEEMVVAAEYVTIADSSHYWTTPDDHHWHNVKTAPVHVGRNTWLCPKSTVTRGTRVGACCLVASNSVVRGDIPDGSFASGVPAVVGPNALPWRPVDAPRGARDHPA